MASRYLPSYQEHFKMPQMFQVLRCYKCSVFQVHQTKKANKFECKLCGEKQSIKRHYALGTAKDCRLHVQKLNGIQGENNELIETTINEDSDNEVFEAEPKVHLKPKKSKWSHFVDKSNEDTSDTKENEIMYLNNTEVVLEIPKKKRKRNYKCPSIPKGENTIKSVAKVETESFANTSHAHNNFLETNNAELHRNNPMQIKIEEPKNSINIKTPVKKFVPPIVHNSKWSQFESELKDKTTKLPSSMKGIDDFDYENNSPNTQENFSIDACKNDALRKAHVLNKMEFDEHLENTSTKYFVLKNISSGLKSGSKWAQYVDTENVSDESFNSQNVDNNLEDYSKNNEVYTESVSAERLNSENVDNSLEDYPENNAVYTESVSDERLNSENVDNNLEHYQKNNALFALCDDSELDEVFDF